MADFFRDEEFEQEDATEGVDDLTVTRLDFHSIVVGPADWTINSLQQQIGKQIDLNPEFQRRGVWSKAAKSSFVESLFLNIPIPQILLAAQKDNKNKFIVLDGKQRLLTISEFFASKFDDGRPFRLSGMRVLNELEGKTWDQISKLDDWPETIQNHTQRTAVLRGWKNEGTLYEIFHRLNSGSVKLSPMELRMSLYPGKFLKYAIERTEDVSAIHRLLRLKRPDKRMADVELLIRFFAFSDPNIQYGGNLKQFLDGACIKYNTDLEFNKEETEQLLEEKYAGMNLAIGAGIDEFGDQVCRKYKNGEFETRFNRAVFDVVVKSLANSDIRQLTIDVPGALKQAFVDLSTNDPEFINSLETTTKSVTATKKRFTAWHDKLVEEFGLSFELPNIKDVE